MRFVCAGIVVGMRWDGIDAEMLIGFEEIDMVDDDVREEFPCPFCSEYYDIVGLCCHIDDEHPLEAKNGVFISLVQLDHWLFTLKKIGKNFPICIL